MPVPRAVSLVAGMQAQQSRPVFTGLWSRLAGVTRDAIHKSMAKGDVVRSLLMRGTLHLVERADYDNWRPALQPMLSAGAQAVLKDRIQTFSPEGVLKEARALFATGKTFTELRDHLVACFPQGDERAMGYYVRTHLPLVSVYESSEAWGFSSDAPFTLAPAKDPGHEPQRLLERYLAAFGPAMPADFQAWSGMKGAKAVFDACASRLIELRDEESKRVYYDLPNAPRPDPDTPAPVRMIAEFDNLVLSHAERSRIVAEEHRPRIITKNLQIPGTFTVDGFVAGTWKWDPKKRSISVDPFGKLTRQAGRELEQERSSLEEFLTQSPL